MKILATIEASTRYTKQGIQKTNEYQKYQRLELWRGWREGNQ